MSVYPSSHGQGTPSASRQHLPPHTNKAKAPLAPLSPLRRQESVYDPSSSTTTRATRSTAHSRIPGGGLRAHARPAELGVHPPSASDLELNAGAVSPNMPGVAFVTPRPRAATAGRLGMRVRKWALGHGRSASEARTEYSPTETAYAHSPHNKSNFQSEKHPDPYPPSPTDNPCFCITFRPRSTRPDMVPPPVPPKHKPSKKDTSFLNITPAPSPPMQHVDMPFARAASRADSPAGSDRYMTTAPTGSTSRSRHAKEKRREKERPHRPTRSPDAGPYEVEPQAQLKAAMNERDRYTSTGEFYATPPPPLLSPPALVQKRSFNESTTSLDAPRPPMRARAGTFPSDRDLPPHARPLPAVAPLSIAKRIPRTKSPPSQLAMGSDSTLRAGVPAPAAEPEVPQPAAGVIARGSASRSRRRPLPRVPSGNRLRQSMLNREEEKLKAKIRAEEEWVRVHNLHRVSPLSPKSSVVSPGASSALPSAVERPLPSALPSALGSSPYIERPQSYALANGKESPEAEGAGWGGALAAMQKEREGREARPDREREKPRALKVTGRDADRFKAGDALPDTPFLYDWRGEGWATAGGSHPYASVRS